MALYPPILSSTQVAIPARTWGNDSSLPYQYGTYAEIWFTMPTFNPTETVKNGHCELSIRYKSSGDTVINKKYSPNDTVYFFSCKNKVIKNEKTGEIIHAPRAYLEEVSKEDRIWKLCFQPEEIIRDRRPEIYNKVGLLPDEEYSVQIRFGEAALPNEDEDFYNDGYLGSNFSFYARWWQEQVDEQLVGEWSNSVILYSFDQFYTDITGPAQAYKDFIPSGEFIYSTKANDAPVRAELTFTYYNGQNTQLTKRIELSGFITNTNNLKQKNDYNRIDGEETDDPEVVNTWSIKWDLGVFSYTKEYPYIDLEFTLTTEHGVEVGVVGGVDLYGYWYYYENMWGNNAYYLNGGITDHKLIGEERDDGMIAKDIYIPDGASIVGESVFFKVFRVNVDTAEAIELNKRIHFTDPQSWTKATFKDYVIEHGEKFIYFVVRYRQNSDGDFCAEKMLYPIKEMMDGVTRDYFEMGPEPTPLSYFGRLIDMQYSFLTTKEHQLRLAGNMTLNSISWNTQDALQTTIGSRYPFYTRNSATKYRTMQIGALISVQLDPTATFLELDTERELYIWKEGYNRTRQNEYDTEEVILDSDDILMIKQVERSRHRVGEPDKSKIESLDTRFYEKTTEENQSLVTKLVPYPENFSFNRIGPYSEFAPNFDKIQSREYTSERTTDMILLERKYREKVMEWLTNGRPKLFRSPTEGNIIVVLSAISFTPFQNSDRMVYSFSATATEVAEYNLDNLIDYNLIPAIFTSSPIADDNLGYSFTEGDPDPYIELINKTNSKDEEEGTTYGKRVFKR